MIRVPKTVFNNHVVVAMTSFLKKLIHKVNLLFCVVHANLLKREEFFTFMNAKLAKRQNVNIVVLKCKILIVLDLFFSPIMIEAIFFIIIYKNYIIIFYRI